MPRKIILDTDPGVDDVLAILMALASPETQIALISIVFGNTHAPVAHGNLLKIYYALAKEIAAIPETATRYTGLDGPSKTKLAMGEDGPIGGDKAVAAYFHGVDGLSNITNTHPHFTPPDLTPGDIHDHLDIDDRPAHDVILDILRTEPEQSVTIVALGPLTNLAHALRIDPATFAKVHTIIWMGGALDHPGNTSPSAEFNCFADPYAAVQIIDACKAGRFDLIMAPLDITIPHQIPFSDLIHASLLSASSTLEPDSVPVGPLRSFVSAMLLRVRGLQASFGLPDAMEMHDPVAVWYAIMQAQLPPHSVPHGWQLEARDFKVERIGEHTRGMCVVDRRGQGDSGEERTKSTTLDGSTAKLPDRDDTIDRMGNKTDKSQRLPYIITETPGKEQLRRLLLSRVFGEGTE